jgi:hypothetical protein
MKLKCDDFDSLTHSKYTIGGCPGCGHCKIYSDGTIICILNYGIVETRVPDLIADVFTCKGYQQCKVAFDFGCLSCESFDSKKDNCKQNLKSKILIVRLY